MSGTDDLYSSICSIVIIFIVLMHFSSDTNRQKLQHRGRLVRSFILDSHGANQLEDEPGQQGPATLLSMINPTETKEKMFQDALSVCSGRSCNNSEIDAK